jgi:8-oxo-dGTP pyrophosphatase MutT (NUDIX family)
VNKPPSPLNQNGRADASIRLRAALAVVQDGKILLVPHYDTGAGPVQWNIPGGRVNFGESVYAAACREFQEETGLQAEITGLMEVSEVLLPERPYHSITITFRGRITGGMLRSEPDHRFGDKMPGWFSVQELRGLALHPKEVIHKALATA